MQGFGGQTEGSIPLVTPECRCVDNIKMDLLEMGCGHGLYRSASEQGQVGGLLSMR